jgi:GT2 family glycosyltransferase
METQLKNKKLIVVLGMHRSGTSVVTRSLQVLGVELGDRLLPPLPDINEKGFWEDVDINSLNIKMLAALKSDWHYVTPIQPIDVGQLRAWGYFSQAVEILRAKTANVQVFGFKDPRVAKLLLFWKDVFAESGLHVSYVISMRNPFSIAESLAKRDGFEFEKSYLLWLDHIINSLLETEGENRMLVDYDRVLLSPDMELARMAKQLQLHVDSAKLEEFKTEFLDVNLRHTAHQPTDLMNDQSTPFLVRKIYAEIVDVASNPGKLNSPMFRQKLIQWKSEYLRQKPTLVLVDKLTSMKLDRDQQIAKLTELAKELSSIKSSRSWGVYVRLIDLIRRLIPLNSAQSRLFDIAWKSAREIYLNGLMSFFSKAIYRLKNKFQEVERWFTYSRRKSFGTYIKIEPVAVTRSVIKHDCRIDIIVCVYNALDDVARCLDSIQQNTNSPYHLILVDDGSSDQTREYLKNYALDNKNCTLLRNEQASGYTRAANQGLRASGADFLVLINSDTVVGPEWLDRLYSTITSNEQYGVVGPLSNTASWQSIPKLEENGDWAENPLPEGVSVERMCRYTIDRSGMIRPEVKLLNGFCMMLRRAVIDDIGYFDEENFGDGYGEEDDFNLRARSAGWKLVIADDVYIYHAQSKSYSHERRRLLSQRAGDVLRKKHGVGALTDAVEYMHPNRIMESIRARSKVILQRNHFLELGRNRFAGKKVLFILPIMDAGGGGNIVIDEAGQMQKMGVDVALFNLPEHNDRFMNSHPHLDIPVMFGHPASLVQLSATHDAIIATVNYSVEWLIPVKENNKRIILGYYVQGFEPLMYPDGSREAQDALKTYTLIDGMRLFTKTEWVRNMVLKHATINSTNIGITLNTDLFRPRHARQFGGRPVVIVAMVRPGSPYRNPKLTMEVLRKIENQYKYEVDIRIFGSDDIRDPGLDVPVDFNWTQTGKLTQRQVANLLSDADIFVDYSSHQAMGLTALEAMACGCAVIVPSYGGAVEFVRDRENGIVVDTSNIDACFDGVKLLIDDDSLRKSIQLKGLQDIARFYPEKAAFNILSELFDNNQRK